MRGRIWKAILACLLILLLLGAAILSSFTAMLSAMAGSDSHSITLDEALLDGLPKLLTREMIIAAVETQQEYGVPAALTLAQIVLESSGNKPGGLSSLAYECNNLFGIKGEGPAGYKEYTTKEQTSSGKTYTIAAKFRKYNNVKESVEDHAKLLTTSRYKVYTASAKTSDEWAIAIWKAGYATDTQYPRKLQAIMKKYDLYRFDDMSLEEAKSFGEGDGTSTGSLRWPLNIRGTITSYFGPRRAPTAGASSYHQAIDIAAPSGTYVYAADGGTVEEVGYNGAMGYTILIKHGKGLKTRYCHLRAGDGILVKKGQKVSKGQKIGRVGTTGASTGNHLDFKVMKNGTYVDPLKYVTQPKK